MSDWQTMETAPQDGTPILVWVPSEAGGYAYVVRWDTPPRSKGGWIEAAGEEYAMFEPTHWMPLPPAPTA